MTIKSYSTKKRNSSMDCRGRRIVQSIFFLWYNWSTKSTDLFFFLSRFLFSFSVCHFIVTKFKICFFRSFLDLISCHSDHFFHWKGNFIAHAMTWMETMKIKQKTSTKIAMCIVYYKVIRPNEWRISNLCRQW